MSEPIRTEFAMFPWRDDQHALVAWRKGKTGFPIVDAAMRELWHTGFMPNRAPYFRVFNPVLQGAKFDPDGA